MGFSNNKEEIDVSYEDELNPKIIYSRLWLEENLDNPTLLNNFIYLWICRSFFQINFSIK